MIRIHQDNIVPKYLTGKWYWSYAKDKLNFISWKSEELERELVVVSSNGFKFKATINQVEEVIFQQEFTRPNEGGDSDVVKIEDIKNLVLFLAPTEMVTKKFVSFVHTRTVDYFLNALIIYFEYFLRVVEYILIRRDEISGKSHQVESTESTDIKRVYSKHLSQYRLLLAREYSEIIMGYGEMVPYYHLNTRVQISKTYKDRKLHEVLLAFATQVVWIAHHRRALDVIDTEMNRLFRSDHFKLNRTDAIEFTKQEQNVLFGPNNVKVNARWQNSPLIQEIKNVRRQQLPLLWIGEKKYRGNDPRMQQLELEYIIPDSDLSLLDLKHGILGNKKNLYTTMLTLDWEATRERGHSEYYDPFLLFTQPYLEIPKLGAEAKKAVQNYESYFSIKDKRYQYNEELIKKWKQRDKLIDHIKGGGLLRDVVENCRREVEDTKGGVVSVAGATAAFKARRKFLRKK